MEAVFYPNTNRTSLWHKDGAATKMEIRISHPFHIFDVSSFRGSVSWFIINTDAFHTLTHPSKQPLNLGLFFFTSSVFQLVVLFYWANMSPVDS